MKQILGNNEVEVGGSHFNQLVKKGLSKPLSKGLNVVRKEHSSKGNSLGKRPEAGTTSMCSKRKTRVAGAGVKKIIRYEVESGD